MASTSTPYKLPDGRMAQDVSANKTFAAADGGIVWNVIADALTLTAPASATVGSGYSLTLRNGGLPKSGGPAGSGDNGSVGITLTMATGDGTTGAAFTAAINKGPVNTKATALVGDEMKLGASGANTAAAWQVRDYSGVWTRLP